MNTKVCTKCGVEKLYEEFRKQTGGKFGLRGQCKQCEREYQHANKERQKQYQMNNAEAIREQRKRYREKNQSIIKQKKAQYYMENRDTILAKNRKYYIEHAGDIAAYRKIYYAENRTEIARKYRIYSIRLRANIIYKLKNRLRKRLNNAINNNAKIASHIRDLGCSIDELKTYLESQFQEGMTWYNYGTEWHIDHIIPFQFCDLENPDHQRLVCHYTNLRPMWAAENIGRQYDDITPDMPIVGLAFELG